MMRFKRDKCRDLVRDASTRPSPITGLSTTSTPSSFAYAAAMDNLCPYYRLVLFRKSSQEYHFTHIIKDKEETLNLFRERDEQREIRAFLHSEVDSIDSPTFNVELYMAALRTELFDRLLIWSTRLPSTYNVISKGYRQEFLLSFLWEWHALLMSSRKTGSKLSSDGRRA